MNKEIWVELRHKIATEKINFRNIIYFSGYDYIMFDIAEKIQKYGYYTYDGRFEDAVIDFLLVTLKNPEIPLDIEQYASQISMKMKRYITHNMILVPLNHLNTKFLPDVLNLDVDRKIAIFNVSEARIDKHETTPLEVFFAKNTRCNLNKQHIFLVKDRSFFNYPILAIAIEHIDYRVQHEAPRIIEAAYSFLRMLDFSCGDEPNNNGCGVRRRDGRREASTYVVYNKDPDSNQNNLSEGNLGYSYRFKFAPNLDVNTVAFINDPKPFTRLLAQAIDVAFMNPIDTDENELKKYNKWLNAVILFNTAYEFASVAKYDSALLLLVVILESLFLKSKDETENSKNENNKKSRLSNRVSAFLSDDTRFTSVDIKSIISQVYDYRNTFIHEGFGLERQQTFWGLNDDEGSMRGQKPFKHGMFLKMSENEYHNFLMAIKIVIAILTKNFSCLPDTKNYPVKGK